MAKKIEGAWVFGEFKLLDTFMWTDPTTGQVKPIRSLKVLISHGDGTVTLESLALPPDYTPPRLAPGESYGFPCRARLNKKKQIVNWDLRGDPAPIPSPELE